ncbi:hypothetical protein [Flavobacterium sp.]|uniref:hypothetical protein n=1 Tax=Flavobacterium sp. TaxID=239 RepID=UPI0012107A51|nr:hypothetical protein [Flavobacterium sp.]RZJ69264.1 MAG: hypothetical protein EOO49_18050 [Flavobacterium sp.]
MKSDSIKPIRKRPKTFFWVAIAVLFILIVSVVNASFFTAKKVIRESEIHLGNDLREQLLQIELWRNDSSVVLRNESRFGRHLVFESADAKYELKITLNAREVGTQQFEILGNGPKFIYAHFDERNSSYSDCFEKVYRAKMLEKTNGKALTKAELRKIAVAVKRGITLEDLAKIGYDINAENVVMEILDEPFPTL